MRDRRSEDHVPAVLNVSDSDVGFDLSLFPRVDGEEAALEELVLVYPTRRDGALVVGGRAHIVPKTQAGRERIETLAGEWHRERIRVRERADAGERFVVFAEQTSRACSSREVLESLIEHAGAVAGGYRPVIWAEEGEGSRFMSQPDLPEQASETMSSSVPSPAAPVLITRSDAESSESFAPIARLYETTGSTAASLVSLGKGLVLVVLERRSDRTWEPRHWFLLRAMARLAQSNLERLEALEEIGARRR